MNVVGSFSVYQHSAVAHLPERFGKQQISENGEHQKSRRANTENFQIAVSGLIRAV